VRGRRLSMLRVEALGAGRHTVRVDTFTKRGLAVRSVRTVMCSGSSKVKHRRFDR